MPIIDNAIYVDGIRAENPASLEETYEALHAQRGMAWIGLYRPDASELESVATEFGLHPLAVEDASAGHQRAKLERYGDTLFVVLRPARYIDEEERVEFGEIHLFLGPSFVVTIRHAESPRLSNVRQRLEALPDLLALGPEAVLYTIFEEVVRHYGPVADGLQNDIDEIEDQLFGGHPDVSRRIYELLREVIGFQRSVHPLVGMLEALLRGAEKYDVDIELQRSLRAMREDVLQICERVDAFRVLLQNSLTVHSTLVTQRQNDEMRRLTETSLAQSEETRRLSEMSVTQNEAMKKVSSWAAILFAPSLIGTIYGMNFDNLPGLHSAWGYPLSIVAMIASGCALYYVFKRRRWL